MPRERQGQAAEPRKSVRMIGLPVGGRCPPLTACPGITSAPRQAVEHIMRRSECSPSPWRLGDSPRRGGRAGAVAFLVKHLLGKTGVCLNKPRPTRSVGPFTMRTVRNGQPTESACQTRAVASPGSAHPGGPAATPCRSGHGTRKPNTPRRPCGGGSDRTKSSARYRPGRQPWSIACRSRRPGAAGAAPARPRSPSAIGVGIPLVRGPSGTCGWGVGHASTVRPDPSTLGVVGVRCAWWARQGLNLSPLPGQQNPGTAVLGAVVPGRRPTVESKGKRSLTSS
jgi:hypothetical protein